MYVIVAQDYKQRVIAFGPYDSPDVARRELDFLRPTLGGGTTGAWVVEVREHGA